MCPREGKFADRILETFCSKRVKRLGILPDDFDGLEVSKLRRRIRWLDVGLDVVAQFVVNELSHAFNVYGSTRDHTLSDHVVEELNKSGLARNKPILILTRLCCVR